MSTLHDRLLLLESKIDSMRGLYNLPPSFPSTPPPGDRRTFKQTATNVQVSFTDKSKITKSVEITTTQYQGSLLFFGSFFFFFFWVCAIFLSLLGFYVKKYSFIPCPPLPAAFLCTML
jgi:hypothetical protein